MLTLPAPAGVAQVPSPRQKVEAEAAVPLLRFVTGRFPVTPVERGRPVAFVRVIEVGVPKASDQLVEVPSVLRNLPALPVWVGMTAAAAAALAAAAEA